MRPIRERVDIELRRSFLRMMRIMRPSLISFKVLVSTSTFPNRSASRLSSPHLSLRPFISLINFPPFRLHASIIHLISPLMLRSGFPEPLWVVLVFGSQPEIWRIIFRRPSPASIVSPAPPPHSHLQMPYNPQTKFEISLIGISLAASEEVKTPVLDENGKRIEASERKRNRSMTLLQ